MLETLREFFARKMDGSAAGGELPPPESLRLAASALLLELAYADDEFSPPERAHLERAVRLQFGLDRDEAQELVRLAERERARGTDLWTFTNLIADRFTLGQKMVLVEAMWELVFSDGVLARREEYLLKRITGLLRLEAADVGEARAQVERRRNLGKTGVTGTKEGP